MGRFLGFSANCLFIPFRRWQEQDVYCVSVLPDQSAVNLPCESQLALSSFLEVPIPLSSQTCLDAQLNCQNCISLQMESADPFSSCIVAVDIEAGNLEKPKASDETPGNSNFEDAFNQLHRAVRRHISLQIGGKVMQLLISHGLMVLKFMSRDKPVTETVHETPNNKWRKYKRTASFDSRKIVLLFSALSSMGTMVLIYLTLRVRQTGDGLHG
ncbi:uncharacterized protein LOC131159545 [Malania oleifera]|uniref:uncharacterized protein LOC131159545 n=1 Tax=Malania oleifera TaxID=397392 RepID=UPI0025ADF766|nr:uncharacterized protein LOC131159545 [Malania oleifera]